MWANAQRDSRPAEHRWRPLFNAAKILWGHVEDSLLLNKFFPTVDTCLRCKDMARQSCAMVPRW